METLDLTQWPLLIVPTIVLLYGYFKSIYGHWRAMGIPGPRPLPFVGTVLPFMWKGEYNSIHLKAQYGDVVGLYIGQTAALQISDPKLVKLVMVKDFASYPDRRTQGNFDGPENYPMRKGLIRLKGDHWKHVRHFITPTFTSGKLKDMCSQLNKCGRQLTVNIEQHVQTNQEKGVTLTKYFGCFTMDAIAATAFGIELDCHRDTNNPFVKQAKSLFDTVMRRAFFFMMVPMSTKLASLLGFRLIPRDCAAFFMNAVNSTMKLRQENNIHRPDFLQSLMTLKVDDLENTADLSNNPYVIRQGPFLYSKKGLTEEEVLAQSLLFFFAGYETTATTLTFLGYCLATNPDCQATLIREIDQALEDRDHDADVTYEDAMKLPYLSMCVSETLRLYPPAPRTSRVCAADTLLGDIPIMKGTVIGIPVFAMHRDPHLWPDPESFQPGRWTEEEKAKRDPYGYLPFGHGPRSCIGMRLALLEINIAVVHVLRKFEFYASPETEVPLKLKFGLLLGSKKDIIVCVRPRQVQ